MFAAAADLDLELPDLSTLPDDQVGATLAQHFIDTWERSESLQILLRTGVTKAAVAERMQQIFAAQLVPTARTLSSGTSDAETRAGLAASQVLGLALCRYILKFPPVTALSSDEVIAWIGPTLQRYLVGDPA